MHGKSPSNAELKKFKAGNIKTTTIKPILSPDCADQNFRDTFGEG
jgi:hypothetical protein